MVIGRASGFGMIVTAPTAVHHHSPYISPGMEYKDLSQVLAFKCKDNS